MFAPAAVGAGAALFEPNVRPTLDVRRAPGPIDIDGDLSDPGWRGAARAINFSETDPGDNAEPPVSTEVLVTYDDEHFYMAFLAGDDPDEVRASLRDRDEIWQDDYVGIILDTYADAAWAYELFVNPLGIQGELRWVDGDEDLGFDIIWESRGKITEDGFQVEVAVPFSSLRFPDRPEQSWRATFWRNRPRESRCRYSWAAVDRDEPCWVCNFGTLTGISGIKAGRNIELMPSWIGFRTSELRDPDDIRSGLRHSDPEGEASLGLRYAINSSMSVAATLNPDFSQIESDAEQVDVNTTFALFYPERRPFFQEGSDLFETYLSTVYTRTINDPTVAAKLTGRSSVSNFAYIGARDENTPLILPFEERSEVLSTGKSTSNILRLRRNFGEDSHVGGLVTDRRWDDKSSGSVLSMDGGLRLLRNYRFEWQVAASHTDEPNDTTLTDGISQEYFDDSLHTAAFDGEDFWGQGLYASIERDGRHFMFDVDYGYSSPTFRAPNGFLFRNDRSELTLWSGVYFRKDTGILEEVMPMVSAGRVWNSRGVRKDEWIVPGLEMEFKGQTRIEIEQIWSRETFREIYFPEIRRTSVEVSNEFLERVRGGVEVTHVNHIARNLEVPAMGNGTDISAWAQIKPMMRLMIQPSFEHSSLYRVDDKREIFRGYVLRTRTSLQITRRASLRFIVQYDDFDDALDIEPLFSYKVSPFTVFYLGSTHTHEKWDAPDAPSSREETERQIFLKWQYLIQR